MTKNLPNSTKKLYLEGRGDFRSKTLRAIAAAGPFIECSEVSSLSLLCLERFKGLRPRLAGTSSLALADFRRFLHEAGKMSSLGFFDGEGSFVV